MYIWLKESSKKTLSLERKFINFLHFIGNSKVLIKNMKVHSKLSNTFESCFFLCILESGFSEIKILLIEKIYIFLDNS